jgi:hypothetical protein
MAGSFENNEGVLPLDQERKYYIRGNFDFSPLENLEVSWNTSYTNNDIQKTPTGDNAHGITLNAFRRDRNYFGTSNPDTIDQVLDWDLTTAINRLITGITARYVPTEHVTNRLTIGYDLTNSDMRSVRPFGFFARRQGIMSNQRWSNSTLTFDYLGTLNLRLLDQLSYAFSWGGQAIVTNESSVSEVGVDFPPGDMTLSSAAETLEWENRFKNRTVGILVQHVLGYKDRLFLILGGRADYADAFDNGGLGSPQLFPKASVSYVFSDEPFWPVGLGQLRLRFAYSQTGKAPSIVDPIVDWTGNYRLDRERTSEIELGFDAELLNNLLALDFTYYHQKTSDALFTVLGSWRLYESVGEMDNSGIELAINAAVLTNPHLGWDVGFNVFTNKSRVLDLVGAAPYSLGSFGWLLPPDTLSSGEVRYYSVPEIRSDCIIASEADSTIQYYASAATGTPVVGSGCTHGPNFPTLTLGFNTTIRLPKGIQIVARGEYQGGHFVRDDVSSNALTRSVRWPYCFEAYPQIEAGNEGNLSTWLQSTCLRGNVRAHWFVYPADFFKLRELSATVPVAAIIPAVSAATLTFSARNIFRWRNKDFPVFDAEMMGDEGIDATVRTIGHHVPLPATFTAFLRVVF